MIANIYKPVSWTSFDVVKKLRNIVHEKKVGHGGTLDPFAEGVLIIGTGKDTKSLTHIAACDKTYEATVKIGVGTDTMDREGKVIETAPVPKLTVHKINKTFADFTIPLGAEWIETNENIFKQIKFKENKDILHMISNLKKNRPKIVCGFAAETNSLISNARKKLINKNCDFIFANKISNKFNPLGNDFNQISIIGKNNLKNWNKMSKKRVAEKIIQEVSSYLN